MPAYPPPCVLFLPAYLPRRFIFLHALPRRFTALRRLDSRVLHSSTFRPDLYEHLDTLLNTLDELSERDSKAAQVELRSRRVEAPF